MQVLVFNRLHLFGGIVLVYLIPLMKMPVNMNRSLQILIGFVCGLLIDIFSNTLGMHALACTTLMLLRDSFLYMFVAHEDFKTGVPCSSKLGPVVYGRFALLCVVCFSIMLYAIEAFTLFNLVPLVMNIVITSLLTLLFVWVVEVALSN